jgi:hypothetical protein
MLSALCSGRGMIIAKDSRYVEGDRITFAISIVGECLDFEQKITSTAFENIVTLDLLRFDNAFPVRFSRVINWLN